MRQTTVFFCIASHNRKEKTLKAIASIDDQHRNGWDYKLVLLDDSSSDGTSEAVREQFPDTILLSGSGDLYWGGGMNASMKVAIHHQPDFIVMLNDDCMLHSDAIQTLLSTHEGLQSQSIGRDAIVIGAMLEPSLNEVSYSGFVRLSKWRPVKLRRLDPTGVPVPVDAMNGNLCLIPKSVYQAIGPVDGRLIHQLGDIDYAYRAWRAGFTVWLAAKPLGICASNIGPKRFERPGLTLVQRWRAINHPLGLPVRSWIHFMWRHGGLVSLAELIAIYVKALIKP